MLNIQNEIFLQSRQKALRKNAPQMIVRDQEQASEPQNPSLLVSNVGETGNEEISSKDINSQSNGLKAQPTDSVSPPDSEIKSSQMDNSKTGEVANTTCSEIKAREIKSTTIASFEDDWSDNEMPDIDSKCKENACNF